MLAHQGGWDEVLLVIGPLAAIAGLLWLAKRRVMRADTQVAPIAASEPTEPIDRVDRPSD